MRSSLILGLLLLCAGVLRAQETLYNFNTNSGLPSDEVYCTFLDREGYMWFGTDHGVAKYNGYKFEQFTTEDGMTDNTVFSIKQDEVGNMWFLTLTGGICYYDGKKVIPHPMNDSLVPIFNKQIPTSWEILPGKVVWLGFTLKGFYRVDSTSMKGYLRGAGIERDKTLDQVTVHVLTLSNSKFLYTSLLKKTDLQIDVPDVRYIKTYTTDAENVSFLGLNYTLTKVNGENVLMGLWQKLLLLSPDGMIDRVVLPIEVKVIMLKNMSTDTVWATCSNAPSYMITTDSKGIHFIDSITSAKSVTDILTGRHGSYWLSTLEKGVYMMPNLNIKRYLHNKIQPETKVMSLFAYKRNLYAGLERNAILKIDSAFIGRFIENMKDPGAVTGITFSEKDEPISANTLTARWTPYGFFFKKVLKTGPNTYLAGGSGGFMMVSGNKALFNSHDIGFEKRVTELCRLTDNNYLVGTTNGLYQFNAQTMKLEEDTVLSDLRITSCKALNANTYAIATRGKGVCLAANGKKFWIDESSGLVSNLAEDIYFESPSICWVASYKGLSKIYFSANGKTLETRIKSFTKEDGLCSNQVNAITGYNGYLWLGTNEGICFFKSEVLRDDTVTIPMYFRDTYVNGTKRTLNNAELKYNQNNITIEFNGLYYRAVSGVRYKFRIKGMEDWKYTDRNSIQYFGLPAAEYDFEIAAEDKFGRYRSNIQTLHFTIHPHFTDTIYFTLLMALGVVLITGTFVYMILRYQKLKNENLIKLLQAEFKALNYQINPHFIFNVLNSIQYFILGKDTRKAVHFLSSFSALIRKIVNNSKQEYISILEEVECLKEYLDLEKLRLEDKFDYEINIDSNIDIEDKLVLPMILQPIVENCIWHGLVPADRQGKINISFFKDDGHIVCTIEDNGVGINYHVSNQVKGLNNLSLAIKNVTDRLKIISELNNSTWDIKLEDKSVKNAQDSGTLATIVFPSAKPIK